MARLSIFIAHFMHKKWSHKALKQASLSMNLYLQICFTRCRIWGFSSGEDL